VTFKTNNQSTYLKNEQTTYTITITNPGPSDAYNVVVSDPKPYNITLMTWYGNDVSGSGDLNNTIPVLAAGETMVYTVTIFVPENHPTFVGPLTNVVAVTSDTPDPTPACPGCTDSDTPAGDFVTVTQSKYTVPELVEDVLIGVDCMGVQNIT